MDGERRLQWLRCAHDAKALGHALTVVGVGLDLMANQQSELVGERTSNRTLTSKLLSTE